MSTLAFRKSAVDQATPTQRKLLRMACTWLDLGEPALYQTGAGQQWYIFNDGRIWPSDIAAIGRLCVLLTTIADFANRAELRSELSKTIVWPVAVADGQDPYDTVLAANGAPGWVRAGGAVPSGLTPVGSEAI